MEKEMQQEIPVSYTHLPALGVVASVSTVTNRQMKYCEEAGIKMVKLPMHDILSGKEDTECYLKEVVEDVYKRQVQEGDSLWDIAKKFHTTMGNIITTKELPGEQIKAGQRLLLVKEVGV